VDGSWLNTAESLQRTLKRPALAVQHPRSTGQIIAGFEASAKQWDPAVALEACLRIEAIRSARSAPSAHFDASRASWNFR